MIFFISFIALFHGLVPPDVNNVLQATSGRVVLFNEVTSSQYLDEQVEGIARGVLWASSEGPLTRSPVVGSTGCELVVSALVFRSV